MRKFYTFLLTTTFATGLLFSGLTQAQAGFGFGPFGGCCGYRPTCCVRPVVVKPVRCYVPVRYYTIKCRWVPGYRTCDGCVRPGYRVCWRQFI